MADRITRVGVGIAAAFVCLLQFLSVAQVGDQTYRGYVADSSRVVIDVGRAGPAERAGVVIGDRIIRIGSVDAADAAALEAQPRAKVGEVRELVVLRGGRVIALRLTYQRLPPIRVVAYLVSNVTGISFLGFGLWALVRIPRTSTTLLALSGVGLGAAFVEMPYFASPVVRATQDAALLPMAMFGFVFLLHFTLVFPLPKRMMASRYALPGIYTPPALVAGAYVLAIVVDARGLRAGATQAALIVALLSFALSAAAMVHGYVTSRPPMRASWGLHALLASVVLGLAPIVATAVAVVAPRVVLPGSEYYDLVWVLIPFALARSAVRHSRSTPGDASPAT
jgi:hypothetical protein